jgi:hypothetical protein
VRRDEPLPTELAPKEIERKQKRVNKYKEARKYRLEGDLDVRIYAAPSSQAAQELMLLHMIASTMPTEGIVATYARAERPKDLGTVSFVNEYGSGDDVRIKFVRDNILVEIFGEKALAQEALPLARKIDALMKAKAFTKAQLAGRTPAIKMASEAVKKKHKSQRWVSFDVTVLPDTRIVYKRAFVDGEDAGVIGKGICILGRKSGKAKVSLTVMTDELVSATLEQEVAIEE